jgi:glycosyltransferase involved in cell wall biosynthesis
MKGAGEGSERRMRVLYVQPGRGIGGAKISLYNLVTNHPTEVACQVAMTPPADKLFTELIGRKMEKIHQFYLPTWHKREAVGFRNKVLSFAARAKRGGYLWPTIRLSKIILQNRIDLVHTNSTLCPVGALAARLTHRPHIWHIRERIGAGTDFPLRFEDGLSARLIRHFSREIICISDYTADFFRKYGIEPIVIMNGINIHEFEHSENQKIISQKRNNPNSQVVIGMVGSLRAEWKEHELFLKAMALVLKKAPQVSFIVYGGTSDLAINSYTHGLNELAISLGLTEHLTWASHIHDIPAMMYSLDIFVHPTSTEGSGRVVMEAMAAGKPVIATKSGGVQELIEDGITGYLVPAKDPHAFAEKVLNLIADPAILESIGQQAQSYALKHFSHERTALQILNVYAKILRSI